MTWTKERGERRPRAHPNDQRQHQTRKQQQKISFLLLARRISNCSNPSCNTIIQKINKLSDFVRNWTVGSGAPYSLHSAHRRPLQLLQRGGMTLIFCPLSQLERWLNGDDSAESSDDWRVLTPRLPLQLGRSFSG